MGRIPMTNGFVLIPEGEYIFKIDEVKNDEDFGKIEIKLVTSDGLKHTERFSLKNADDTYNEGALGAFSYFCKTAMNDFSMEDIDPDELVGHFISAEVVHNKQPNRKDPTKTVTFANLGDKSPAEGFDEEPTSSKKETKKKTGLDINALLG
ncbi:MAG: hypothetical protein KH972_08950 [Peptostreptococcaceae bacterium]|nr:hypothetical protein [Peptostreptococcaceae bacterium]